MKPMLDAEEQAATWETKESLEVQLHSRSLMLDPRRDSMVTRVLPEPQREDLVACVARALSASRILDAKVALTFDWEKQLSPIRRGELGLGVDHLAFDVHLATDDASR
jgi:hypothetical protein